MLLGMIRLAGKHMKFWKSAGNQLEFSWKINCSCTMGHKSNVVRHDKISWKSSEILEISWKSAGNQLDISWKINCSSSMGHTSNVVRHDETSWKSYEILEIWSKSVGSQLEISWKSVGK